VHKCHSCILKGYKYLDSSYPLMFSTFKTNHEA
jgi:hypothetical protein